MVILINEISEKYINKLGKNYFNTVKLSEASSAIRKAVEETAEAAKEEIKQAIEPFKSKIAKKDEFISSLKELNEGLETENKELQKEIDNYKPIIKEAYKQGITQEIREKKNLLGSILSGLIHHKEEINKPKVVEQSVVKTVDKPVEKPVQKTLETPVEQEKSDNRVKEKTHKVQSKKVQTPKFQERTVISDKIVKAIEAQRKNQKLDKARLDSASIIIKALLGDAPQDSYEYRGVQAQFKKTMDKYLNFARSLVNGRYEFEKERFSKYKIGKDEKGRMLLKEHGFDYNGDFHSYTYEIFNHDGSSMEIYDGNSDSYIEFRDTTGKKLLKVCYGQNYSAFIYDKNGRLMVSEAVKDGAIEYLDVKFNEVKPILEIENDEGMNAYAKNLISKAKHGCKKQQEVYRDTTDIEYFNKEGKISIHEYYVNKKINSDPVFTYLYNAEDEQLKKLITNGDFGLHAKYDEKKQCFVQYRAKGITGIDKRRKNNSEYRDFNIGFYKSAENEHYETQSLYDENYKGDKDTFLQREVYEKWNYGLVSMPLTKSFTFHDLTKHQIKPWDFSILKPYL